MAQPSSRTTPDLTHISEAAWSRARKRLAAIQPLLTGEPVSKGSLNNMRKPLVFTYPACIDAWKRIAGPNNLRHYSLQSPAVRPDRNVSRRVVRRLFHCGKSGKRSPTRSSPKCLLELDNGSQQQFLLDETRHK